MIDQTRQSVLYIFIATLACLVLLIYVPHAKADSNDFNFTTGCSQGINGSYTAILDITEPRSIYVKLGSPGQTLQVSINQVDESLTTTCRTIANATINGSRWTQVGVLEPVNEGRVVIEVVSPALSNVPDANRPSVLLVDTLAPVCIPKVECDLTVAGVAAYVRPPTTLSDKASLKVGIPTDPSYDKVEKVDYYVDGKQQYSTPTLMPFDMRYVSYARQPLIKLVHYKSGQEIVYASESPSGFSDSFANFLFRTFKLESRAALIGFWTVVLVLTMSLIYVALRILVSHYRRLRNHGIVSASSLRDRFGARFETLLEKVDAIFQRFFGRQKKLLVFIGIFWLIPALGAALYFGGKNFVIIKYDVNGKSMTNTLKDGQSLAVNRLPQTWATLNNSQIKLKRGDVIVADAVYGLTSKEMIAENQHTVVKRVLGLPGERITVINGVVRVYNTQNPTGFEVDKGAHWEKTMIKDMAQSTLDITLGSDEVFISGDNRPGSVDSRENGPIKVRQIVGKVLNDNH